ncbi:MAG: hypothetical protein HQM09_22820, partial [Candidatus Riflebacteria bacterium]|nr:hypothetical protein [Candidatus Riflebacteria bacterium]
METLHAFDNFLPQRNLNCVEGPAIPLQLELPQDENTFLHWTVAVDGPGAVSLSVDIRKTGAHTKLTGCWPGEPRKERAVQWESEINVRTPIFWKATCRGDPGALISKDAGIGNELIPLLTTAMEYATIMGLPVDQAGYRAMQGLKTVRWSLETVQRHLVSLLVPHAGKAASLFPIEKSMRWAIYELCAADETGRVSQLASICPGLLTICCAIGDRSIEARYELLKMVIAGARLGRILDKAVDIWAKLTEARSEILRSQRIRIAHAGPLVPPAILWQSGDYPVIPEDIPLIASDNLCWYMVQSMITLDFFPSPQTGHFAAFLSRHAVAFVRLLESEYGDLPECYIQIFKYLVYLVDTGRCISRMTKPEKLIAEYNTWYVGNYDPRVRLVQMLDPGPAMGLTSWECDFGVIRFIATGRELIQESMRMHHCVAGLSLSAERGQVQIFHGEIDGERATIKICFRDGKAELIEAKGITNRELSQFVMVVIQAWLDDLTMALNARRVGNKIEVLCGSFSPSALDSNESIRPSPPTPTRSHCEHSGSRICASMQSGKDGLTILG